MARVIRFVLLGLLVVLVLIQFVPVDRTNPPVTGDIVAPAEVKAVLRQSCYDCHSNETVYPWFDRIAPVSWLVARDVREARDEMNFSTWQQMTPDRQYRLRQRIWKEVAEGEMPPWFYLPVHPKARLTEADKAILRAWSGGVSDGRGRRGRGGDD